MSQTLRIQSASRTDKGNLRELNEDACIDAPGNCLWAVADGMGGHSCGDLASRMMVDGLRTVTREASPGEFVNAVEDIVLEVNGRLYDMSAAGESQAVIGTTLALLAAFPGHCVIAWVGDSRIYRLRAGKLEQLTRDHSEVEELITRGEITREQAQDHAAANVVTRAVGGTRQLFLDLDLYEIRPGDRFLLCTDGLYKELTEHEMGRWLDCGDVTTVCEALIEQALRRDCRDNVTVVIVDFQRAIGGEDPTIVHSQGAQTTRTAGV